MRAHELAAQLPPAELRVWYAELVELPVSEAVAKYKSNVETFADKEAAVAEADLKALVQSHIVEKFGLPPTAAQFISSGIHHLFTVAEGKMNSLIEKGATAIEAATGATDTAGSTTTAPTK